MYDVLIVMALADEGKALFEDNGFSVLVTGVGKINSSYSLTKYLMTHKKPNLVINVGSAGCNMAQQGMVAFCDRLIQRDMNATALGFKKYETPFDAINTITTKKAFRDYISFICQTSDSFVSEKRLGDMYDNIAYDMEAYALAKVCQLENVNFLCLKYITDGADSDAAKDWTENVNKSGNELLKAVQNILNQP